VTNAQFRLSAQQLHKSFCAATFHFDVDTYAVMVYIPDSVRRYRIVGMGSTMEAALEEAAFFKKEIIVGFKMEEEPLEFPDMGTVAPVLKKADEEITKLWDKFNSKKHITQEEAKAIFDEMDGHAQSVGHAYYEATKDRNSLENCLTGCGRSGPFNEYGAPGWIPTQIRQMVFNWAKSAKAVL
jgi:predicted small lipoprotein YifL